MNGIRNELKFSIGRERQSVFQQREKVRDKEIKIKIGYHTYIRKMDSKIDTINRDKENNCKTPTMQIIGALAFSK